MGVEMNLEREYGRLDKRMDKLFICIQFLLVAQFLIVLYWVILRFLIYWGVA